jgi:hypothetical protein
MVEQLHRVQLRAVARQEVQLDALGMASNPAADRLGPVHPMAIHDQVDLLPAPIAQQPTNTGPLKAPTNSRNQSIPALEMALIMLTRNRLPVPLMTGVWPTGAHDRPAAASDRTPSSSRHTTIPPSRLARARMAGEVSASQRGTAAGFCSRPAAGAAGG